MARRAACLELLNMLVALLHRHLLVANVLLPSLE
jgi:hypothetical protein